MRGPVGAGRRRRRAPGWQARPMWSSPAGLRGRAVSGARGPRGPDAGRPRCARERQVRGAGSSAVRRPVAPARASGGEPQIISRVGAWGRDGDGGSSRTCPRGRDRRVPGRQVREWRHLRNPSRCAARDRAWKSPAHARCRGCRRLSVVDRVRYANPPARGAYTTGGTATVHHGFGRPLVGK